MLSPSAIQIAIMSSHRFQCLFTHQKAKKRKTWQEGICVIFVSRRRAQLFRNRADVTARKPLEECTHLSEAELSTLAEGTEADFEMDRHLVTLDGALEEEKCESAASGQSTAASVQSTVTSATRQTAVVKRKGPVVQRGFKKPKKFKPPARQENPAPTTVPASSVPSAAVSSVNGHGRALPAGNSGWSASIEEQQSAEEKMLLEEQYHLWQELASASDT